MPTTAKGIPYPAPEDGNDVPADMQALAEWVDLNILLASRRGAVDGVASLDGGGKVPSSQLPAIVLNETFTAASESTMLGLTAQPGDVAIRLDLGTARFLLTQSPASTLANWVRLLLPTDGVVSVEGRVGAVTLGDLFAASTHTHDAAAITSGVLARARLGSGTPAAGRYVDGGTGQWTDLAGGAPLDYAELNPTPLAANLTTLSLTPVDVHTDLAVSFVGPASGYVRVTREGFCGDQLGVWSLRSGSSDVPGSSVHMGTILNGNQLRCHTSIRLPVTPGNSYTWKWAWRCRNSTFAPINMFAGGAAQEFSGNAYYGPAAIAVYAA